MRKKNNQIEARMQNPKSKCKCKIRILTRKRTKMKKKIQIQIRNQNQNQNQSQNQNQNRKRVCEGRAAILASKTKIKRKKNLFSPQPPRQNLSSNGEELDFRTVSLGVQNCRFSMKFGRCSPSLECLSGMPRPTFFFFLSEPPQVSPPLTLLSLCEQTRRRLRLIAGAS